MKITELIQRLQEHLAAHGDLPVQLEIYAAKGSIYTDPNATVRILQTEGFHDEAQQVLNIAGWAPNTNLKHVNQPKQ